MDCRHTEHMQSRVISGSLSRTHVHIQMHLKLQLKRMDSHRNGVVDNSAVGRKLGYGQGTCQNQCKENMQKFTHYSVIQLWQPNYGLMCTQINGQWTPVNLPNSQRINWSQLLQTNICVTLSMKKCLVVLNDTWRWSFSPRIHFPGWQRRGFQWALLAAGYIWRVFDTSPTKNAYILMGMTDPMSLHIDRTTFYLSWKSMNHVLFDMLLVVSKTNYIFGHQIMWNAGWFFVRTMNQHHRQMMWMKRVGLWVIITLCEKRCRHAVAFHQSK